MNGWNIKLGKTILSVGLLWCALATTGHAKVSKQTMSLPTEGRVQYIEVLPDNYDPSKRYPIILAFGGGPQTERYAGGVVHYNLREEAEKRGYIVVAPIATVRKGIRGEEDSFNYFFAQGDRIFPEFLDAMLERYPSDDTRMHVMGPSNGGMSSLHVAVKHPNYFKSITVWPGHLRKESNGDMAVLKDMCITYYVGSLDQAWVNGARVDVTKLTQLNIPYVAEVFEGVDHSMRNLAGPGAARIFDRIESCKIGQ